MKKVIGVACPAFLKEIRTLLRGIPESGGVSGLELELHFIDF